MLVVVKYARRMGPAVAVSVVTLTTLLTAPASAGPNDDLAGTWRSAGYGMIITIDRGPSGARRMTSYQATDISCLGGGVREQVGDTDPVVFGTDGDREVSVRRDGDRLRYHQLGTVSDVTLSRLPDPPACPSATPPDAAGRRLQTFEVFWQTLAENYPPYPGRQLDLSERERDRATLVADNTGSTLDRLLRGAVRALGDQHTDVTHQNTTTSGLRPGTRDSNDMETDDIHAAIQQRLGGTLVSLVPDQVEYATGLPHGLGYLRIADLEQLGGKDGWDNDRAVLDKALDTVFTKAAADHWSGLILDLRLNDGGWDALGLDLAGRLTTQDHVAYRKHARDREAPNGWTPWQRAMVHRDNRPGFHGPVALLVSDLTVSAGETSTLALLGNIPKPTLIGRDTQGIFSDQVQSDLSGGWSMEFGNEEFTTPDGTGYEGYGIPVPEASRTPVFEPDDLKQRCDRAIARAIDHLTGAAPGTTPRCRS